MVETGEITFELELEMLQPVLGVHFKQSAEPKSFTIKALKPGAGNPTSLGVYRVSGEALVQGSLSDFSVVVKHLADGKPFMDASEPKGWNYWRRETAFFESPLAARIPSTIGHPSYLGETVLPDGSALFWNGDLGNLEKSEWTWDGCLTAAKLVAELNSVKSDDLSAFPWLNRSQVEGWAELHRVWNTLESNLAMLLNIAQSNAQFATSAFAEYLDRYDRIAEILSTGRHSFVHGDFNLNNLVPPKNQDQMIALDWQLCGEARIGTEVAAIYNTAIEHKVTSPTADSFEQLCAAYTHRFNDLNPADPISLNEVRLAAAAMGYFIMVNMPLFFMNFPPPENEDERRERLSQMATGFFEGAVEVYAKVLRSLE